MDHSIIESQFNEGTLLASIDRSELSGGGVLETCVELHNAGRIDLIHLIEQGEHERLAPTDFFPVMQFYCQAIPRLKGVSAPRMMGCVSKLVKNGGADMAARMPNSALLDWCKADEDRADEIISQAERGEALAVDHLCFALQAKANLQLAHKIVTKYDDERRLAGLTALSRMPHPLDTDRSATIAAIAPLVEDNASDALRGHTLSAIVHVHEGAKAKLSNAALTIVEKALVEPGDLTLHGAAHALLYANACLSQELVEVLLAALLRVGPQNEGTICLIDSALDELLTKGYGEQAISYVTQLLSQSKAGFHLKQFDDFIAGAAQGDPRLLEIVVVKWLLSGKKLLCEGVGELARERRDDNKALSIDFELFKLSDSQTYFVCRKAIGYLFVWPVVAGSILVSALRSARGDLTDAIKGLLFDPLLVNFGGALRRYLESIEATDAAFLDVQKVLSEAHTYVSGIAASQSVKELHPAEDRRQLERLRMLDFSREVNKKAQQNSIFFNLVHRSVLLHGLHSITLVQGENGETRPVEMKLQSIEHSVEWPRMETVDPVRLDMILGAFRVEQIRT